VHFLSLSKTVAFSLMTFMWMQFWMLLMLSGWSAAQALLRLDDRRQPAL
jgi:hypothetical protein